MRAARSSARRSTATSTRWAESYGYDGELNRTVTVSTAAITEALRNVYPNPRLLEELGS